MNTLAGIRLDRRGFLRTVGAASAVAASGTLLGACGSGQSDDGVIRIGYVSPETGPLSPFGEADQFVIEAARAHFAQHPVLVGGTPHRVEILKKDSQSSPTRAGDVAADLIRNGGVHIMLVSSTPETANPVSDECEASGLPCIATVVPWQPWFFGRGGRPDKPFNWTFQFFFGLEDFEGAYLDMWNSVPTNKVVGALWPADSDGFAWGNPSTGVPSFMTKNGYTQVDPGNFAVGNQDFTGHITAFKQAKAEIVVGVPTPLDFARFWRQSNQQEFRPKIVTIAKANPFPSSVEALGPGLANNIGTDVWWSPNHPFTSSLTGQSARDLADAYTAATGKQWTMPIGFAHTLVEVAVKAFTSVSTIDDRAGIANAIRTMKLDTVVGPLDWTTGPAPGAASAPMVGGQWRASNGGKFPFELVVVNNQAHPNIPTSSTLVPL